LKVLVITFFHVPFGPADQSGIQRRFGVHLRALARLSDDITLLHIVPAEMIEAAGPLDALSESQSAFWGVKLRIGLVARNTRQETRWEHYGAGIFNAASMPGLFAYGGDSVVAGVATYLAEAPDIVFAHRPSGILPILRSRSKPRKLIFDMDDIEHKVVFRHAVSAPFYAGKLLRLLQLPALIYLERQAVAAARLTFVCSRQDQRYLSKRAYGSAIRVVPNALPVPNAPPGLAAHQTVLLLGDMKNPPNHMAAARLISRIWPLIRATNPEAKLLIGGRGSDSLPSTGTGAKGVEFLGFVDDLDALYARSRVVCCPIMTGGGTRLKLVEAASYARPMVSTTVGAEGLDFVDGQHILLRDDDAGFAAACVELLRDDALCRRLGAAAREVMVAQYDARQIERQIADMIGELQLA
jgi:glycosyltransferase involved in cell wall biosynthesis